MKPTIQQLQNMLPNAQLKNVYMYGSRVYGTFLDHSDYDFIIVADGVQDHQQIDSHDGMVSIHTYTPESWQQMLTDHKIFAMECHFLTPEFILQEEIKFKFDLNLPLLRKEISSKTSNSWVKCKKKLEVEKDYLIGIKSLFHSFRIAYFGIQVASLHKIASYDDANYLWEELKEQYHLNNFDWSYYKEKYQQQHNTLMTEFRTLAAKE